MTVNYLYALRKLLLHLGEMYYVYNILPEFFILRNLVRLIRICSYQTHNKCIAFYVPEGSLPPLQQLGSGQHSQSHQSSLHCHTVFKAHFNIII